MVSSLQSILVFSPPQLHVSATGKLENLVYSCTFNKFILARVGYEKRYSCLICLSGLLSASLKLNSIIQKVSQGGWGLGKLIKKPQTQINHFSHSSSFGWLSFLSRFSVATLHFHWSRSNSHKANFGQ